MNGEPRLITNEYIDLWDAIHDADAERREEAKMEDRRIEHFNRLQHNPGARTTREDDATELLDAIQNEYIESETHLPRTRESQKARAQAEREVIDAAKAWRFASDRDTIRQTRLRLSSAVDALNALE